MINLRWCQDRAIRLIRIWLDECVLTQVIDILEFVTLFRCESWKIPSVDVVVKTRLGRCDDVTLISVPVVQLVSAPINQHLIEE